MDDLIRLTGRAAHGPASATLTLPFEQRTRARLRVTLDDGVAAGLLLERGQVLRDGDLLVADNGLVVCVRAAAEAVSSVRSDDALALARAAYHLGNRHVPLQIAAGLLRYRQDHVLDDMVRGLGLGVVAEQAPFEPEAGAYRGGGHAHDHVHDH
ncbi:MAG: urease accessory protein UreE [Gammaproteobacteria bacterium]